MMWPRPQKTYKENLFLAGDLDVGVDELATLALLGVADLPFDHWCFDNRRGFYDSSMALVSVSIVPSVVSLESRASERVRLPVACACARRATCSGVAATVTVCATVSLLTWPR